MKVYLTPVGLYSRAMVRIANALTYYAPSTIQIIDDKDAADLCVMYVISLDFGGWARELLSKGKKYACVQCCVRSISEYVDYSQWLPLWRGSSLVWSYYELSPWANLNGSGFSFYHAPLGVDDCFRHANLNGHQRQSVITSGYVSGDGAEAIEEVWIAAGECNLPVIHIGPNKVKGINARPSHVTCIEGVPDSQLAWYYSGAKWVASLRHTEGFELPALEGVVSGARGILFAQSDLRRWYKDHAVYVDECHGEELVNKLVEVFSTEPEPVTKDEQKEVMRRFDWKAICGGFWTSLLREVSA